MFLDETSMKSLNQGKHFRKIGQFVNGRNDDWYATVYEVKEGFVAISSNPPTHYLLIFLRYDKAGNGELRFLKRVDGLTPDNWPTLTLEVHQVRTPLSGNADHVLMQFGMVPIDKSYYPVPEGADNLFKLRTT